MNAVAAVVVPDDALLIDIAAQANAQHLHVISNGKRCVLSPTIPDGWTPVIVKIKTPTLAQLVEEA